MGWGQIHLLLRFFVLERGVTSRDLSQLLVVAAVTAEGGGVMAAMIAGCDGAVAAA